MQHSFATMSWLWQSLSKGIKLYGSQEQLKQVPLKIATKDCGTPYFLQPVFMFFFKLKAHLTTERLTLFWYQNYDDNFELIIDSKGLKLSFDGLWNDFQVTNRCSILILM